MKQKFFVKCLATMGILLTYSTGLVLDSAYAKKQNRSSDSVARQATGSKVFTFDTRGLRWAVYGSNGKLIRSGHGVGGKSYCADVKRGCRTPTGNFRLYHKVGANFRSSKYPLPNGGAPMPWGMFFHKGYAIHGSNDVPNHPASHGCIRVYPSDARWLNGFLPIGTRVIVR